MRLDKFISSCTLCTRKEASRAISKGQVLVNGKVVKDKSAETDAEKDTVVFNGQVLRYSRYTYIMVNKPEGVVSATEDKQDKTVLDLLPEEMKRLELFPCGRLDKNTVGLVLMTNNGPLAHFLLSPASHVSKRYSFTVKFPMSEDDLKRLEQGVDIGGYVTKPCRVSLTGEREGVIILTEGKYHQIKLMMKSVNNQITFLKRESFGSLTLDPLLEEGGWRYLTDAEISLLHEDTGRNF